jgi:hypothetical protein
MLQNIRLLHNTAAANQQRRECKEVLQLVCGTADLSCIEGGKDFVVDALQRYNTENPEQIFPGKELRGYGPNFYIHVSVSDLYIPLIGLPILLQENRWTERGNI